MNFHDFQQHMDLEKQQLEEGFWGDMATHAKGIGRTIQTGVQNLMQPPPIQAQMVEPKTISSQDPRKNPNKLTNDQMTYQRIKQYMPGMKQAVEAIQDQQSRNELSALLKKFFTTLDQQKTPAMGQFQQRADPQVYAPVQTGVDAGKVDASAKEMLGNQ